MIKYKELQDLFVEFTFDLEGYDYDDESSIGHNLIRLSYQDDSAPFQPRDEVVTYIWLRFGESELSRYTEASQSFVDETLVTVLSQMRMLTCQWTFYGNEAQDIAYDFRSKLFAKVNDSILAKNGIKMLLNVPEVILNFEEINQRWWPRVDLIVNFYITTDIDIDTDVIEALNIKAYTEKGEITDKIIGGN